VGPERGGASVLPETATPRPALALPAAGTPVMRDSLTHSLLLCVVPRVFTFSLRGVHVVGRILVVDLPAYPIVVNSCVVRWYRSVLWYSVVTFGVSAVGALRRSDQGSHHSFRLVPCPIVIMVGSYTPGPPRAVTRGTSRL
jgi:hypothetical protein